MLYSVALLQYQILTSGTNFTCAAQPVVSQPQSNLNICKHSRNKMVSFLVWNIHIAYLEMDSKSSIWKMVFPLLPARNFHFISDFIERWWFKIHLNWDKHIRACLLNAALTLRNGFGKQFDSLWSSRFQTGTQQSRGISSVLEHAKSWICKC